MGKEVGGNNLYEKVQIVIWVNYWAYRENKQAKGKTENWEKFKVLLVAHRNVRISSSIHSSKLLHRGMHSTRKRREKDQVCLIAKAWYHCAYQGTQWTEQIWWKLDLSFVWSQLGLFTRDFQREMNLTWYVRRIKTLNDCWFLAKICLLSDKLLVTVMLHVKNSRVI